MKPPARRRSSIQKPLVKKSSVPPSFNDKWTVDEKKSLLGALKRFGSDDPNVLKETIPTKSAEQIEMFIRKQRIMNQANWYRPAPVEQINRKKAPIELWEELAENLTAFNTVDHSLAIGQVLSVIGHLEPHEEASSTSDPNYPVIYKFIAGILRGESPEDLSGIDAAVLLDVLQNLADRLRLLDTRTQHKLMEIKYQLLAKRHRDPETVRIALGDPLELTTVTLPSQTPGGATITATGPTPGTSGNHGNEQAEPGNHDNEEQAMESVTEKSLATAKIARLPAVSKKMVIATPASNTDTSPGGTTDCSPGGSTLAQGHSAGGSTLPQGHSAGGSTGMAASTKPSTQKRKKGASRCSSPSPQLKPLFSLNPLGIPVKYLNPRPAGGQKLHPTWPQPRAKSKTNTTKSAKP